MNPSNHYVRSEIQDRNIKLPKSKSHLHKLQNIRHTFSKYSEESTPKPALSSDMYTCVGRLKFYPDGMLYMYLEVSINPNYPDSLWPATATWKVEVLNENNTTKQFTIGERSYIFNKPKQGFVSHPNDWIAVNRDKLESSQMIEHDGSMTIRWTVIVEPTPELISVKQLKELLCTEFISVTKFTELLHQDQLVTNGLDTVSQISKLCSKNTADICSLNQCVKNISDCHNAILMKIEQMNSQLALNSSQIVKMNKEIEAFNNNVQNF